MVLLATVGISTVGAAPTAQRPADDDRSLVAVSCSCLFFDTKAYAGTKSTPPSPLPNADTAAQVPASGDRDQAVSCIIILILETKVLKDPHSMVHPSPQYPPGRA